MERKPAIVSRNLLAMVLEDMAERVRKGDCFGGGIEFHYWDDENGAKQDEYSALGAYRVGNREGQGGMRLIESGVDLKNMWWASGDSGGFLTECVAERDGDCNHEACPQLKDRQSHCPLDNAEPSA